MSSRRHARRGIRRALLLPVTAILAGGLAAAGCTQFPAPPQPAPKPTASATARPTQSPKPTASPTASPAPTRTATPSPAPTRTATPLPTPTATPSPTPTATPSPTPTATGSVPATRPLPATTCQLFPADNAWHADVSKLPVSPQSAGWLSATGANSGRLLHPDFGPSGDPAHPWYGIPYTVVPGTQPKIPLSFDYADESDRVGYPIDANTKIEAGSDQHALIVDKDACRLYEVFDFDLAAKHAGSGATWDLRSNALRPAGWTSADAAGLPILPGLLRVDEVKAGKVDHAVRVTFRQTAPRFVWPARHQAGSNADFPPMGARFRLRADYPVNGLRADTQVVLSAFKKYGLIVADNGSDWYFGGTAEAGWDTGLLDELKRVPASAFQAVDASGQMVSPDSGQSR